DDWRMFVEAVLCRAATLRRVASAELILPRDVYNRANSLVVGHVETLVRNLPTLDPQTHDSEYNSMCWHSAIERAAKAYNASLLP
ncbi:MAG TPA: hypothetical protein VLG40_01340, partial [Candidatus Saccharimonas sp.]|nr:hypothetical protein [Candidatus Saccharimonas sp.]